MEPLERLQRQSARLVGRALALPGLGVYRSVGPSENTGLITGPTLTLVIQGAKTAVLGDRVLDYRAGQYLVVTVDLPMTSRVVAATEERPFLAIGLTLRPVLLGELIAEGHERTPAPAVPAAGVSDADAALIDAFERLLRMPAGSPEASSLAPGVEREIHWRLLTGPQGAALRALGISGGRLDGVVDAIGWIRAHLHEVLRADDVARAAHMSVPTLNRRFRAVTGLSPGAYQKLLRLHDARFRLFDGNKGVATIGYEVGYESRTQFTREYKRLFGHPPSGDAGRSATPTSVEAEPEGAS